MFLGDVILAFILGLISAAVFSATIRTRHGMPGIVPVFILFFLFAWFGGLWLRPFGPPIFEVYWLPSFILIVLVFLLLASITHGPTRTKQEVDEQQEVQEVAATVISIVFWFLIAALVVVIIIGYLI